MTTGARADGPAAKLRLACDLFASGVAMMRQTLRRRFPSAAERTIADRLARWLLERALDAARLIVSRGFARGKELVAEVAALLD